MPGADWMKKPPHRLIPEHFNMVGDPKKRFKTQDDAELAAWMNGMKCYECSFCGDWHLANKEK